MIKNFKINSDDIYEILEKLTHLVNTKQLSKLDYSKWKILSNLAKKVDKTIYFDCKTECSGPTVCIDHAITWTFWFGDSHIVLHSSIPVEKFVTYELAACAEDVRESYSNTSQALHQELTKTLSNISIEQTDYDEVNKLKINKREENNMFKNFKFGPVENSNVKISPYGIAIMNNSGTYVSYDKDTEEIVNVDILNFKCNNMLYMMPVAIKDIQAGDVVIHNRVPMIITVADEKDNSRLFAIDVASGEEKVILPTKSPFGFNFITKIVSLLDMMPNSTSANESNPFGNLLPFMIMGDNNDINPLMFMALSGNADFASNPMMLYALAASDKDSNNLLPLMLMGMNINK
jgi:hypothetical protein